MHLCRCSIKQHAKWYFLSSVILTRGDTVAVAFDMIIN